MDPRFEAIRYWLDNPDAPLNEAEASIFLESPIPNARIKKIVREWFEARRLVGIEPYGKENLLDQLRAKLNKL